MLLKGAEVKSWRDIYSLRDHRTIWRERFHRIEDVDGYLCLAVNYTAEITGYLPPSELGMEEPTERDLHRLLCMPVPVQVADVIRADGVVVLSRRMAVERLSRRLWETVVPGQEVEGTVISLAFPNKPLELEVCGVRAEVPATELYWDWWISPRELQAMYPIYGDVRGRVLEADRGRGKLVVSLKALRPDPWASVPEGRYRPGSVHSGVVIGRNHNGMYVRFHDGVVCLCTRAGDVGVGDPVGVVVKEVKGRKVFGVRARL